MSGPHATASGSNPRRQTTVLEEVRPLSYHEAQRGGFRRDQQRRGLRPRTIKERDKILDSLERWADGRPVMELGREDIESWLDELRIVARSRSVYLGAVHNYFQWAISELHRTDDPTSYIRRPRAPRLIPRPISDDDLTYALRVAPPLMRAWICLAAYQGFRCHEIASLRREDILERHDPPLLLVSNGKGGHQAVLPLNTETRAALVRAGLPGKGAVFRTMNDRPFQPSSVSRRGCEFFRAIGIDVSLHQCRHWFGTAVWAATKDLRITQEMLRHASPHTTAGYAAFDPDLAAEAIAHIHERTRQRVGENSGGTS